MKQVSIEQANIHNLIPIEQAHEQLESSGYILLPPGRELLTPEQWFELETLLATDSLPHERVTCGDVGEKHDVFVGRLITDTPCITILNQSVALPVLEIISKCGLLHFCSEVLRTKKLEVCDCRSHIMGPGNFIGPHTDLESNQKIRGFVVFSLSRQYLGGNFLVHHPRHPSQLHLEYRSVLIGDPTIPHEVSLVETGIRHSFVLFLSETDDFYFTKQLNAQ